jgi:hypothetical protein
VEGEGERRREGQKVREGKRRRKRRRSKGGGGKKTRRKGGRKERWKERGKEGEEGRR